MRYEYSHTVFPLEARVVRASRRSGALCASLILIGLPVVPCHAAPLPAGEIQYRMSQYIVGSENGHGFGRRSSMVFAVGRHPAPTTLTYDISVQALQTLFAPGVDLLVGTSHPKQVVSLTRDTRTEQIGTEGGSPVLAYANAVVTGLAGPRHRDGDSIQPPRDRRLNRFFDAPLAFSGTVSPFQAGGKRFTLISFASQEFSQNLPCGSTIAGKYSGVAVVDAANTSVYFLATRLEARRKERRRTDLVATGVVLTGMDANVTPAHELYQSNVLAAAVKGLEEGQRLALHNEAMGAALPLWAKEAWLAGELRSLGMATAIEHRTNPLDISILVSIFLPLTVLNPAEWQQILSPIDHLHLADLVVESVLDSTLKPTVEALGWGLVRSEVGVGSAIQQGEAGLARITNVPPPVIRMASEFSIGWLPGNLTTMRDLSAMADRIGTPQAEEYYAKWTGDSLYLMTKSAIEYMVLPELKLGEMAARTEGVARVALQALDGLVKVQDFADKVMPGLKEYFVGKDVIEGLGLIRDAQGDARQQIPSLVDKPSLFGMAKDAAGLGGIDLAVQQAVEAMDRSGRGVAGVAIDDANGVVRFLSDPGSRMWDTTVPRHEILYTALAAMECCGDVSEISFSLDPASRAEWETAMSTLKEKADSMASHSAEAQDQLVRDVRLPQRPRFQGPPIERTAIGHILLHADMALKSATFGYDYRTGKRVFLSEEHRRLLEEMMANAPESFAATRLWFYLESCQAYEAQNSFRIAVKIGVKTMGVEWQGKNGAVRDTGMEEPHLRALAVYLSEHLDEFAARYPVIEDLEETYRILVALELLRKRGILLPDIPALRLREYDDPNIVQGMAALYAVPQRAAVAAAMGGVLIWIRQKLVTTYSPEAGTRQLEAVFALRPTPASLGRSRIYGAALTRNVGKITAAYRSLSQDFQRDPYALEAVARAHLEGGRYAEAVAYARQGLTRLRENGSAVRLSWRGRERQLMAALADIETQGRLRMVLSGRHRTATEAIGALAVLVTLSSMVVLLVLLRKGRGGKTQTLQGADVPAETPELLTHPAPRTSAEAPVKVALGPDGVFRPIP